MFVASVLADATPDDVLLVLAAGSRLSAYIAATVGEIGFLRAIWLDGSKRLVWLERFAAAQHRDADAPAPATLGRGIRIEGCTRSRRGRTGERRPESGVG